MYVLIASGQERDEPQTGIKAERPTRVRRSSDPVDNPLPARRENSILEPKPRAKKGRGAAWKIWITQGQAKENLHRENAAWPNRID